MIPPTSHRQVFRCPQFSAIYAFLALYMRNVLNKGAKAFIKSYFHCNKKRVFRENSFHNHFELLFSYFIYSFTTAELFQSIKMNIGPSDSETIILSSHCPNRIILKIVGFHNLFRINMKIKGLN